MAISNGYVTLAQFKLRAGLAAGSAHDDEAERAVEAASRTVDRYCARRFWTDSTATARYYTTPDLYLLSVADLYTLTGLAVKTDDDWDGVYENTWTLNSRSGPYGFMVEPVNAVADGWPVTRLRAVANTWPTVQQGVQVTARWGWATAPAPIQEATMILASRWYKRKDTPFAVTGTPETGVLTLPRVDPDVRAMLDPYRRLDDAL